jgi:ABC-type branched-subunit amino acid transport system permease subunit
MATATRTPMTPMRKASLIAGVAYILTFIGSIPAVPLYHDILNDPNYLLGHASDTGVLWGVIGEVICAITGIVTAVALYPVAKRYSQRAALGFVTSRVLEASMIFVGILSVLSLVTLHKAGASAGEAGSMLGVDRGLVALHDWTFLLGPGLAPAINALCIGTVMYRSRLIPKAIPTIGLIGAPLLLASSTASLFGAWDQISGTATLMALPIAAWELSFGVYMALKGFRADTVIQLPADAVVPVVKTPAFA